MSERTQAKSTTEWRKTDQSISNEPTNVIIGNQYSVKRVGRTPH